MEGFGKLYETDALHLAEIIAQLPRRSFDTKARMVLYCYANLYERDGSVPYFNVGSRQLAEFAGCAHMTARRFLSDMEKDGLIVRLGTMKTKSGEFTKRTFWWLEDGRVCHKSSTPPLGNPPQVAHPCATKPARTSTHQKQSFRRGASLRAPFWGRGSRLQRSPTEPRPTRTAT